MADRVVTIKSLAAGSWSTTVKSVAVPNWPLNLTTVSLPSSKSGIGTAGTSLTISGVAANPIPASQNVTFAQQRGSAGSYSNYYLQSWSGAFVVAWEDPISGDSMYTILVSMAGKIDTISTKTNDITNIKSTVESINSMITNGTYGLGALAALIQTADNVADAIKVDVNAIKTLLEGTSGVAASKTAIDAIKSAVENGTNGLTAIKTAINSVKTVVDTNSTNIGTVKTDVGVVKTDTVIVKNNLSDATNGLAAIKTAVNTVDTVVDQIKTVVDGMETDLSMTGTLADNIASIQARLSVLRFILHGTQFSD